MGSSLFTPAVQKSGGPFAGAGPGAAMRRAVQGGCSGLFIDRVKPFACGKKTKTGAWDGKAQRRKDAGNAPAGEAAIGPSPPWTKNGGRPAAAAAVRRQGRPAAPGSARLIGLGCGVPAGRRRTTLAACLQDWDARPTAGKLLDLAVLVRPAEDVVD